MVHASDPAGLRPMASLSHERRHAMLMVHAGDTAELSPVACFTSEACHAEDLCW